MYIHPVSDTHARLWCWCMVDTANNSGPANRNGVLQRVLLFEVLIIYQPGGRGIMHVRVEKNLTCLIHLRSIPLSRITRSIPNTSPASPSLVVLLSWLNSDKSNLLKGNTLLMSYQCSLNLSGFTAESLLFVLRHSPITCDPCVESKASEIPMPAERLAPVPYGC